MSLNISAFNSNSINTLLGSIGTKSTTGLENVLSDYTTLQTGSYGKLLKSYYAKFDTDTLPTSKNNKTKSSKDTSLLSETKKDSDKLNEATSKLLSKGSDSIWKTESKTTEDGKVTKEYNKDKIYAALSDFTKAYNDLVDSGQKSETTGILTQVSSMVTGTNSIKSMLGQVGITIDSKNHLNIDEKFFKEKADMTTAKSLFNGTGSYAYNVATKASMVNSYSSSNLSKLTGSKFYNSAGSYSLSASDVVGSLDTSI